MSMISLIVFPFWRTKKDVLYWYGTEKQRWRKVNPNLWSDQMSESHHYRCMCLAVFCKKYMQLIERGRHRHTNDIHSRREKIYVAVVTSFSFSIFRPVSRSSWRSSVYRSTARVCIARVGMKDDQEGVTCFPYTDRQQVATREMETRLESSLNPLFVKLATTWLHRSKSRLTDASQHLMINSRQMIRIITSSSKGSIAHIGNERMGSPCCYL